MSKNLYDRLPNTLEIPIPIPDPRPRGIQSLGAMSISFSIRLDLLMSERIEHYASQLGITRGEFMRWCAERMVIAIDEHLASNPTDSEKADNDRERQREIEFGLVYPDDEHTPPTPDTRRRGGNG